MSFENEEEAFEASLANETPPTPSAEQNTAAPESTETVENTDTVPEAEEQPVQDDWDENAVIPLEDEQVAATEEKTNLPADFERVIEERYSKFGIKSGTDLEAAISRVPQLEAQNRELQAKMAELAAKADPFENDAQRKLFEFAKGFNGENASAMAEYAHLVSLDVEKMTEKDLLREAFVQENRSFSRAKAIEKFDIDYEEKYGTEGLDPEMDAREIKKRTLNKEFDSDKAKRKLAETISGAKLPIAQEKQPTQEDTRISESIGKTVATVDRALSDFSTVDIGLDKSGSKKFTVGLNEEQRGIVANAVKSILSDPGNYNADGTLKDGKDPKSLAGFIAKASFSDILLRKAYERGLAEKEREIVNKNAPRAQKPITSASGTQRVPQSEEEAFEMHLQKN
jgi:hypothetical protein